MANARKSIPSITRRSPTPTDEPASQPRPSAAATSASTSGSAYRLNTAQLESLSASAARTTLEEVIPPLSTFGEPAGIEQYYGRVTHHGYVEQDPEPSLPADLPDPTNRAAVQAYFGPMIIGENAPANPGLAVQVPAPANPPFGPGRLPDHLRSFVTKFEERVDRQNGTLKPPRGSGNSSTTGQLNAAPNLPDTMPGSVFSSEKTVLLPPYTDFALTARVQVPGSAARIVKQTAVATRGKDNSPEKKSYGKQVKDYPPSQVAPPLGVSIGLPEIFTFFPNWVEGIAEVTVRTQANLWEREIVALAEAYADEDILTMSGDEFVTATRRIQKQFSHAGRAMFSLSDPTNDEPAWSRDIPKKAGYTGNQDLTANNWHFKAQWAGSERRAQFQHVSLKSIYERVTQWPKGPDRLMLTQCLEFAKANEDLDLDTSHWDWIIQTLRRAGVVPGPLLDDKHDFEAIFRFVETLSHT